MRIVVGIPAFCERDWLPATLEDLAKQKGPRFEVWVCVNQPSGHLKDPQYAQQTEENLDTLEWLKRESGNYPYSLKVLDAIRPPRSAADTGVGWARNYLFSQVMAYNREPMIGVSLDADTRISSNYIENINRAFQRYPNAVGLTAPYYHKLPRDGEHALRLLRYEIYMRYYQIQLWLIGSPYAFTAIGSAIAFRGEAYRKVKGFSRRKAGEDYYFLQALRKLGPLIHWIDSRVYPSSRVSKRVPFGTGPLMAEADLRLQKQRFPFYHSKIFKLIGTSYERFSDLHLSHFNLPIHEFLVEKHKGYQAFDKMRRNFPKTSLFVKACHEKLDGLRILQCLRFYHSHYDLVDSDTNPGRLLQELGESYYEITFHSKWIAKLNVVRDLLESHESEFRRLYMAGWQFKKSWW